MRRQVLLVPLRVVDGRGAVAVGLLVLHPAEGEVVDAVAPQVVGEDLPLEHLGTWGCRRGSGCTGGGGGGSVQRVVLG